MSGYLGQAPGQGQIQYFTFIATAGQTTFSGIDSNKYVLNYSIGFCDVFLNGRRLTPTSDYTALDGSTIVLQSAASLNDVVFVASASTFDTADWVTNSVNYVYTATAGQTTFTGGDDNGGTLSYVNGTILVSVNGINLPQTDYTATNGSTVILNSGVNAGDIVQIFSLRTMAVVNFLPLSGGTVSGSITVGNSTVNTQITAGNIALNGSTLLIGNSTSNVVLTGTTITISNSTSNASFGTGPASINAIATNTFTIGTAAYFVANGSIGFGTSSPTGYSGYRTLEVRSNGGGVLQLGNSATNSGYMFHDGNNMGFAQLTSGVMDFYSNGSRTMRIESSGNVAIGSTSATHKLFVFNSSATNTASGAFMGAESIVLSLRSNGANTGASIQISDNSSYVSYIGQVANTGGALAFAPNGTERMRIDNVGNIGVGVTTPSYGFHHRVFGNAELATQYGTGIATYLGAYASEGGIRVTGANPMTFRTNGSERMRIDGSGQVGIGTTTATLYSDLHINYAGDNTGSGSLSLASKASGGGASYIIMGNNDSGGTSGPSMIVASNRNIQFGVGTSITSRSGGTFTPYMTMDSSGNFGINTTGPSYKLDVRGTLYASGTAYLYGSATQSVANYGYLATGTGYFSGTQTPACAIYAPNGRIITIEINCTSDRRLKRNIKSVDADIALAFVNNVNPVSFNWIEGRPENDGDRIGYIAQEVIKAGFPNLVSLTPAGQDECDKYDSVDPKTNIENPEDAFFSMNYNDSAVLLHRALQVALKKIDELEMKVQALTPVNNK